MGEYFFTFLEGEVRSGVVFVVKMVQNLCLITINDVSGGNYAILSQKLLVLVVLGTSEKQVQKLHPMSQKVKGGEGVWRKKIE